MVNPRGVSPMANAGARHKACGTGGQGKRPRRGGLGVCAGSSGCVVGKRAEANGWPRSSMCLLQGTGRTCSGVLRRGSREVAMQGFD